MKVTIHQPEHASYLGIIEKILQSDVFVILDNSGFRHNYFDHRNKIKTQNGWQYITVPTHAKMNEPLNQVKIDYTQKWQKKYLETVKQAYSKAHCFSPYFSVLEHAINAKPETLGELNIEILTWLLYEFNYKGVVKFASQLNECPLLKGTDLLVDICKKVGATTYLSGVSGTDYLELEKFEAANIKVEYQQFFHPVYEQLHGEFLPNMSTLDLLFNYGEDSSKLFNCHGGDLMRMTLEQIPDWQNKRILEMFGGSGSGHLNWYAHRAEKLEIWELNKDNCGELCNRYENVLIKNVDSLEAILTTTAKYDILILDCPATMDCTPLYKELHRIIQGEAVIILRAIKKSWNGNHEIPVTIQIEEVAKLLGNLKVNYMQAFQREYFYSDEPWLENYVFIVEKQ